MEWVNWIQPLTITSLCGYITWKVYKCTKSVCKVYGIIKRANPDRHALVYTLKTGHFFGNMILLKLEQYFRRTCTKGKEYYTIHVLIEGKSYKFLVKPERGPSIEDEYTRGYKSIIKPIGKFIGNE